MAKQDTTPTVKVTGSITVEVPIADTDDESYDHAYGLALDEAFERKWKDLEFVVHHVTGPTVIYTWKADL